MKAVNELFPETEYDPKKFPRLVFRLERPKTSSLLFTSGKIICTGGKSEKEAQRAIRKVAAMLRKQGIVIKGRPTIKIQNVVASVDLGGSISLLDLYMKAGRGGSAMYEPEQFPGLIYRMKEPSVVLLLFSTGKAVCTGAEKEEDVYQAAEKMSQILEKHSVIIYP